MAVEAGAVDSVENFSPSPALSDQMMAEAFAIVAGFMPELSERLASADSKGIRSAVENRFMGAAPDVSQNPAGTPKGDNSGPKGAVHCQNSQNPQDSIEDPGVGLTNQGADPRGFPQPDSFSPSLQQAHAPKNASVAIPRLQELIQQLQAAGANEGVNIQIQLSTAFGGPQEPQQLLHKGANNLATAASFAQPQVGNTDYATSGDIAPQDVSGNADLPPMDNTSWSLPVLSDPTAGSSDPDLTDFFGEASSFCFDSTTDSNGISGVGGHISESNQTDKHNLDPSWTEIDDNLDDVGII